MGLKRNIRVRSTPVKIHIKVVIFLGDEKEVFYKKDRQGRKTIDHI